MNFPAYRYADMVAAAAPPGHRGARTHPPAPGDGHLDGRDAQLDVGLHVSPLRRRPGAAGQQPGRDRRPQPGLAQGAGRRHRHRPDLEGRQLHRAAARHGQRPRLPADRHQHADAVAEAVPHRGGRRRLAGRSDRHAPEDHRRQRHHLPLPRFGGLRPVAAPGADHRPAAGDQLRRRLREPARAADDAGADRAGDSTAASSCCRPPRPPAATARTACRRCGASTWPRSWRRCRTDRVAARLCAAIRSACRRGSASGCPRGCAAASPAAGRPSPASGRRRSPSAPARGRRSS